MQAGIREPWIRTPLDFLSREECALSIIWQYYTELTYKLHIPIFSRKITNKPWDRIPHVNFRNGNLRADLFAGIFTTIFGATFVLGWAFHFPSRIEEILWRSASVYMLVFCIIGMCQFAAYKYLPLFNKRISPKADLENGAPMAQSRLGEFSIRLRNISSPKDPLLTSPIRLLGPTTILCAFYVLFRAFILVEDIIGLRSLPASAFKTVEWSKYFPHF